jgi:5-methylcytosine-specific restriction endonuclease McrA
MQETSIGYLGYALNGYFMRNGLISRPLCNTEGLTRLAQRVSGTPCVIDSGQYLRQFAEKHGIRPYQPKEKRNIRRRKRSGPDPFYLSREWQSLRYAVIRDCQGKCQACGATAQTSGRPMHVDHIIPRSLDQSKALDYSNLQILCEACNLGKSNTDTINWKQSRTSGIST